MTLFAFVIAAFVLLLIWLSAKWINHDNPVERFIDQRRGEPTEICESEWRRE